MVTAYLPDETGKLRPKLPSRCPCFIEDGRECRVGHHHWRQRKTGPCHPLEVVRCRAHGKAFTLYPPGHRPYGRQAVVPLAPDGSRLIDRQGAADDLLGAEVTGGMFEAALDAAAGRAWPRCSQRYADGGEELYWSSQGRLLERCMEVMGVAPDLSGETRSLIAEVLGVERMLLDEQAGALSTAPGYRSRGQAVCAVLRAMPPSGLRYQRLLEGGRLAGLWGVAWYRQPAGGRALVRVPFRGAGTRDPP